MALLLQASRKFCHPTRTTQFQKRLTAFSKPPDVEQVFCFQRDPTKDPFEPVIKAACSVTYYITYHSQSHGGVGHQPLLHLSFPERDEVILNTFQLSQFLLLAELKEQQKP